AAVVHLDVATQARAYVIFELAFRRLECVAQRDVDVLVGAVGSRIVARYDLAARHGESHRDAERVALAVAMMRLPDHHLAARDPIVDSFELVDPVADASLDGVAMLDISERDLHRNLHDSL